LKLSSETISVYFTALELSSILTEQQQHYCHESVTNRCSNKHTNRATL